jgi:hypothetical protein
MAGDQDLALRQSIMDQIDRLRTINNDAMVRLRNLEIDLDNLFQIERNIKPGGDL